MSTNSRYPMVVVAVLLAGLTVFSGTTPVAADVAPPASPPSGTARFVVELAAGAVAIEVKPDHPNVDEIARDAVAEAVVADVEARGWVERPQSPATSKTLWRPIFPET